MSDFILIKRRGSEVFQVYLKREDLALHIKATLENTDHSIVALIPIKDESVEARRILFEAMGSAIEDCSLTESVALLVSQRENARNAHAATQEELARCEATAKARHRALRLHGYQGPPIVADVDLDGEEVK